MVVVFVRIFYQTKDRITWSMITLHVCIPLKDKGVVYVYGVCVCPMGQRGCHDHNA